MREMISNRCTGRRMVLDWSLMERVTAWRIHQCAYVLNLDPRLKSNFSAPRMRPTHPSWMRSWKLIDLFAYRFAIDTTSRKLA